MKRFIDLRGQHAGGNFAWWDTVRDEFERHGYAMAWDTWNDFATSYTGTELERYERLLPNWAKAS